MALPQEQAITPVNWEGFEIKLYVPNPAVVPDEQQSGGLSVLIVYSDGSKAEKRFDLLERLTDDAEGNNTHLPALAAIKAYINARIDSEMLGV